MLSQLCDVFNLIVGLQFPVVVVPLRSVDQLAPRLGSSLSLPAERANALLDGFQQWFQSLWARLQLLQLLRVPLLLGFLLSFHGRPALSVVL